MGSAGPNRRDAAGRLARGPAGTTIYARGMSELAGLAAKAEVFRCLHRPGEPVVLANAWDVASARIVAGLGYPAVATSSAAVAESLGYADGGTASPDEMFAAAARVACAVDVPVTVDAEDGYGLGAAELVERLVGAGAVGCNIEDTDHRDGTLVPTGAQVDRLAEIRAAATAAGVPIVLNARVDVFLRRGGRTEADVVEDAVARAAAYLAAGADCAYPILTRDLDTVARLVAGIPGPVNVYRTPGMAGVRRLAGLGVARVSAGGSLWTLAMGAFKDAAAGFPTSE